jgi:hypothetical protein
MNYPDYKKIDKEELNPMTIVLEAGSNWATIGYEKYLNHYHYRPIFTHAFLHIQNGECINVGLKTKNENINDLISPSHFYLGIELVDMTPDMINKGIAIAYKKIKQSADNPFKVYDVWGFLCFGVRKLGFKVKSSEKFDFCSDEVYDNFYSAGHPLFVQGAGEITSPCGLYMLLKDYEYSRIRVIV